MQLNVRTKHNQKTFFSVFEYLFLHFFFWGPHKMESLVNFLFCPSAGLVLKFKLLYINIEIDITIPLH